MQDVQLHILPCKISYIGTASVSKHFITRRTGQGLQASFRGMPLNGVPLHIPSNRAVVILNSTFKPQGRVDSAVMWAIEEGEVEGMHSVNHYVLSALWDDILQ